VTTVPPAASPLLTAPRRGAAWLWLGLLVAAATLYFATAHRGVQWQDSGWQQVRIATGELSHPLGLALTHPLQFFLGRAVIALTGLEPAYATTLLSGLAAAVAVANVGAVLLLLGAGRAAALIAAGGLAGAHTIWQHATITESYTLVAALLSTEWLILARFATKRDPRWLVAWALVNGLGVSNHLLAGLATPVLTVLLLHGWWRRQWAGHVLLTCAVAWLAGAGLYGGMVLGELARTGDLAGTVRSALVGSYASDVMNTRLSARGLALSLGYLVYNFPNLLLPAAVAGLVLRGAQPRLVRRVLLAQLALYLLFVLRYSVQDQYTFFVPVYTLLAVFAGSGLAALAARWRRRAVLWGITAASVALTPPLYVTTALVLHARGALADLVGQKPYRNGYRAFFIPWGVGEDSADRLADAAFAQAGPNGLILLGDGMARFALDYRQARGTAPAGVAIELYGSSPTDDVLALRQELLATAGRVRRPVVLVPRDRTRADFGVDAARWERRGDLFVLADLAGVESLPAAPPLPSE